MQLRAQQRRPLGRVFAVLLFVLVLASACGNSEKSEGAAGTGGGGGAATGGNGIHHDPAKRVDLLLVIDNSPAMSDKQAVFAQGVGGLVGLFTNPRCLTDEGLSAHEQPKDAEEACPAGSKRQFAPVSDLHVGVISTSVGGHGSDACNVALDAKLDPSVDDKAHLMARKNTAGADDVSTFEDLGFLAWDPSGKYGGEKDPAQLTSKLAQIVLGAGEVGCGYEAQLESWYRFLVQPDPYEKLKLNDKKQAVPTGTDQVLLEQRRSFLRPDSLLAIVMLTDENDCSIRDGGQFYFAAQQFDPASPSKPYRLPKPRAACLTNPKDKCCRSCGQSPGQGCDTSQDECDKPLDALDDALSLRCFDQKRRFGIDFLHPVDRYVAGLSSMTVPSREGYPVPNPLFQDLDPTNQISNVRDPGLVFLAGIVGVPWQDIARQTAEGVPDLLSGLDHDDRPVGSFQNAHELVMYDTWNLILGDPSNYVPPQDPFMMEWIEPRQGTNPVTGEIPQNANPINGHEYTISKRDDLQYACVFDLPEPRDCSEPYQGACDCTEPDNDNPLCQADDNSFGQIQYRAKAYPGLRELQVLKQIGNQAIVGSICPKQLTEPKSRDFGYLAAFTALADAAAPRLAPAAH